MASTAPPVASRSTTQPGHRHRSWPALVGLAALAIPLAGCSRSQLGLPDRDGFDYCFTLPAGERIDAEVGAEIAIGRADLHFLVDNSHSMSNEIAQIADGLKGVIVPGVRAIIPDAEFGLSLVADFGDSPDEHAYQLLQTITADADAVSAKAASIMLEIAGDPAEAQLEGLYQVATGAGLPPAIPAGPTCPPGRVGGACFREDATKLVLLFTDAEMRGALLSDVPIIGTGERFHRQAADGMWHVVPYTRLYGEAADALNALNIFVVGLWSGTRDHIGRADIERIVTGTGAVDENGNPIVFDIGQDGETLNADVVTAIEQLVAAVRPNVYLDLVPRAGTPPRGLVQDVRAQSVDPPGWARRSEDGRHFEEVRPNAFVTFGFTLDGTGIGPSPSRRTFQLEAVFEDQGGARLGEASVNVVVPAAGSDEGC